MATVTPTKKRDAEATKARILEAATTEFAAHGIADLKYRSHRERSGRWFSPGFCSDFRLEIASAASVCSMRRRRIPSDVPPAMPLSTRIVVTYPN